MNILTENSLKNSRHRKNEPNSLQKRLSDSMVPSLLLIGPAFEPTTVQLRVFVNYDCPIARRYAPELNRIQRDFSKKIDFKLVYCDKELSLSQIKKHHQEFDLKMAFQTDPTRKLIKEFGVSTVPTAVVTQRDQMLYFGRIDDAYGKDYKWRRPKSFDLRDALASILAKKPVKNPRTEPIGCALPKSL
jgi:thiol-disulfide isomerase/thioredoxin